MCVSECCVCECCVCCCWAADFEFAAALKCAFPFGHERQPYSHTLTATALGVIKALSPSEIIQWFGINNLSLFRGTGRSGCAQKRRATLHRASRIYSIIHAPHDPELGQTSAVLWCLYASSLA